MASATTAKGSLAARSGACYAMPGAQWTRPTGGNAVCSYHVGKVLPHCSRRRPWLGAPRIGRGAEAEIVVGAPNSLTGGFGENGQRGVWGFLIAADQINREGGIKALGGAKLKVMVADTTTENPTQGASVTRRMLDQDGAVALYGATASAITMAAQVEAEKARVPMHHLVLCRSADQARHEIHVQAHRIGQRDLEFRRWIRWSTC